jgi:uncharacterized caspase-like protein/uncharacterized protein YraI
MPAGWHNRMTGIFAVLALLSVALVAGPAAPLAAEPARYALVIGNSDYAGGAALANPVRDAGLMAETLRRVGFDVVEAKDVDQRAMKRALADFTEKVADARGDAVALLYYAGHGIQVGGINYLIPVDAEIARESDVAIEALALPAVLDAIEFAGAEVNIVILDACRDNPLKRSFRSATRGLARVVAPAESIVAFSTAEGEVAEDGDGANSTYTAALAATILSPGLPIEQVFKQVGRKVKETTAGKQQPFVSSNLYNDFLFVPGSDTPPAPAAAVEPPAETPPAAPGADAEADYLAAVHDDTIEAYRGFLAAHPAAPQAAQVRKMLAVRVEDDAWRKAETGGTAVELRKYLAAFPDGPHAVEAGRLLAALDQPPATPQQRSSGECGPAGPYRVVDIPADDFLSIRSAPGKAAPEIARIPPAASGVSVGRCMRVEGYLYPWCEVSYQCDRGWAYGRYLADLRGNQPAFAGGSLAAIPSGPETYRVTGVRGDDVLNMRSGPGTGFPIVVPIPPDGTGVTVYSCRPVAGFGAKWCETAWRGYRGWASACCLVGERTGRKAD